MCLIETERLSMRKLTANDFHHVAEFLQDYSVMYAWEHAFSDEDVTKWVAENERRYAVDGFSYFLVEEKETGQVIGAMGPLIETIEGESMLGIAYILNRHAWGKGFAVEGARGCLDYCFNNLKATRVIARIRPENTASIRVAKRLGMHEVGEFVVDYRGKKMLHSLFAINKTGM
ncbi:MAG: GNAT family N-acetyltransferase [Bacilli bacterium]